MRPSLRRAKRKLVRTPGGRYVWHRVKKKKEIVRCGICGRILSGKRRIRAFANLCPSCARRMLIWRVREYAEKG